VCENSNLVELQQKSKLPLLRENCVLRAARLRLGQTEERRGMPASLHTQPGALSAADAGELIRRARKLLRRGLLTHRELVLFDTFIWSARHGDVLYNEVTIRETDAGIRGQKLAHISPNHNAAVQAMIIVPNEGGVRQTRIGCEPKPRLHARK
jgi:hypothetical protein